LRRHANSQSPPAGIRVPVLLSFRYGVSPTNGATVCLDDILAAISAQLPCSRPWKLIGANPSRCGATCLVEADAVEEILETWIIAQGIKVGMHLKKLQNVGLFLISSLQPGK